MSDSAWNNVKDQISNVKDSVDAGVNTLKQMFGASSDVERSERVANNFNTDNQNKQKRVVQSRSVVTEKDSDSTSKTRDDIDREYTNSDGKIYPSFETMDRQERAQNPPGSAQSLQKYMQGNNMVLINGEFMEIPAGTDLKSMFGEPMYPDVETTLKANYLPSVEIRSTDDDSFAKIYREREYYGVELADELAQRGCIMGPDGAIYKLPNNFTPPATWQDVEMDNGSYTKDIFDWEHSEKCEMTQDELKDYDHQRERKPLETLKQVVDDFVSICDTAEKDTSDEYT